MKYKSRLWKKERQVETLKRQFIHQGVEIDLIDFSRVDETLTIDENRNLMICYYSYLFPKLATINKREHDQEMVYATRRFCRYKIRHPKSESSVLDFYHQ
jgi:hypothetical protein